jgi:excisionase family DNA binding protein
MRTVQIPSDGKSGRPVHALISKAEAGRVLDLSQRTIRRLVQRGVLEEVQLGPGMRPRLRLADVLALAEPEKRE